MVDEGKTILGRMGMAFLNFPVVDMYCMLELPVAPRLSTFRLTAPTSCQPASAMAYMANISCVVSRFQLRLTQLMQLTELSGAFQKTKATDL